MFSIVEKRYLVPFSSLSEGERGSLTAWFEERGNQAIVDMGNHRYLTADLLRKGKNPADLRVPYGLDMFLRAWDLGAETALAVDENGEPVCVLHWQWVTYIHNYHYTGTLDMRFLDRYDCLFFYECNEFSVELIRTALPFWKGRRLVLVGENWEDMIPLLPDLENVECFYEPLLAEDRYALLTEGARFLHVVNGLPHREPPDRYHRGIMLYAEVMSFTFLFAECQELGPKNPGKKFFLVDGGYGPLGLFALYQKAEAVARYAKSSGFIPVMYTRCMGESFYQNSPEEDVWGKFFQQPEPYTLEEVLQSKQVYVPPVFYNGDLQTYVMNEFSGAAKLTWPWGLYNQRMQSYFREREKKFLPHPSRTLGVLARGTDYAKTHLINHPIHASIEMLCDKIDQLWEEWGGFQSIYAATEDADYCAYLRRRYGDRVTYTDQERFSVQPGEMLANMHRERQKKRDGFLLGAEYALSVHLLAMCRCLLASGSCGGGDEALRENGGKYEHVYVFDLGEAKEGAEA